MILSNYNWRRLYLINIILIQSFIANQQTTLIHLTNLV